MEKGHEIKYLDHGFVRYIDHFGTDTRIVESARISYKSPSKGVEQDKKLLFFLYQHQHGSPFEQCNITYNLKMPIFVMREFVRHRTFRLNELSARYTALPNDFYVPDNWRQQASKNKQSSVSVEGWTPMCFGENTTDAVKKFCDQAYKLYEEMLAAGVAREQARMVLPVNIYTEIYVNCDVRNLMHFFRLRLAPNAQEEIRVMAQHMFTVFKELYPWCAEAYKKYQIKIEDISAQGEILSN